MIIFIILLSNLFSSLVTFIITREIFSMHSSPGDAGVIGLQHKERAGHTDNAGHGEPGHRVRA